MASVQETIRRVRLGDLKLLLRHRYGVTLPDDDAGRDDLELLLRLNVDKNRVHVIDLWAPWMESDEADRLLASVKGVRTPSTRELGQRVRLTNDQRDRLGLRQIAACDVTEEQRIELRKAKRRANARKRRGCVPRQVYEAKSISKQKPWEAEGISRRTWYYRRKRGETSVRPDQKNGAIGHKLRCTSMEPINFNYRLQTCAMATTSG
jgi:hypothetical protein